MTTAIALAGPDDLDRVLSLMARYHEETDQAVDDAHRQSVAAPLLDGSPLGAIWLIGPARAPLGYVMMSFSWSARWGGMVGWLEEAYIRASVRNRGIGTEVLHAIAVSLRDGNLKALHANGSDISDAAARFCTRAGFSKVQTINLMTDAL